MRIALLLLIGLVPLSAHAQPIEIVYDTLATRPVGPGVTHTYIEAPIMPWTINVLEVDLTNPFLEIETAKAHDLLAGGHERTSSMAARHESEGHRVVGAVNGDFYVGAARPVGIQVLDGEILQRPANGRPAVGFDVEDHPMMEIVTLSGSLLLADTSAAIDGVNEERNADELILYNRFIGATTKTDTSGSEVRVRPLGRWVANDTLSLVVQEKAAGAGDMAIPDGDAVLSGHGAAAALLQDRVAVGDTVRVYLGVLPGLAQLKEMVSGGPFLVRDGVSSVGPRGDGDDRHPRTAVGFSADSTRLFLITVDGRQDASLGINLPELAEFMVQIGVHTGMNLDGGGSTTMLVRDEIVNSPSDGSGERTVSNALLVMSNAPEGPLERLFTFPEQVKIFMEEQASFTFYGTDAYFRPLPLDTARVTFSADPGIGTIDERGVFTAGTERDTGYVYVRYDGLVDSARVIVKTIDRFDLTPAEVTTDTSHVVTFSVRSFDQDGIEQDVPPTAYTWSTSDPAVGVVDAEGRFRGRAAGTTEVVAEHRGLTRSAAVTVDVRSGKTLVSGFEALTDWELDGRNIDLSATTLSVGTEERSEGEGAFRIDYAFNYDPTVAHEVFLETDVPIEGVPDSLYMDAETGGRRHRVFYDVEDALGRSFRLFAAAYADEPGVFTELPSAFARASGEHQSWTLYYPVRLKRIVVRLASDQVAGERYEGTVHLDNLRITYPAKATAAEDASDLPEGARLHPVYPNPVRGAATIHFEVARAEPVTLTLYDVLGRRVRTLERRLRQPGGHTVAFDGAGLSPGLYFLRMETPGRNAVRQIVIVR